MPEHWQKLTLGDVLTHRPGKYLNKDEYAAGGQFAVYGSNSVMGSHNKALFDGPLVVMAGIGAYAGAVRFSKVPCWVNNNAFAIFARENADAEWLYFWLECALDLGFVRKATAQPYIDKSTLMVHPILLPSLEEQRRIVDLVGSIDTYIDSLQTQIETTRTARAALLSELLKPSDRHDVRPLGDLSHSRLGKMLDKKRQHDGDQRPYLRNVNIRWGKIDTTDLASMGFDASEQVEFSLRRGDVLVCEGGEPGRAAVVEEEMPGVFFQKALHRVRCGNELLPNYLVLVLEHGALAGGLRDLITSTSIAHLTGVKLRKVGIPVVPLDEQRRIVDLVGSFDEQVSALESQVESVRLFRSGVLSELLSGERLLDESYDVAVGL